ncbi:hypothetical protein DLAC_08512 [Tieghemostelium lacteum]|uniref:Uncharacterized protein n=1 Tax=Tieghemostelium lacteum TaxID=361077 RepID=A0A151Z7K6_TIELA|nr:hypothetical protein DLAC_08512 [Tieghemostelium lacteum]|eukprot:KYQ89941.1 hypothetical protein DLAC_08512 [Tieghemostelium lacteum]
MSENNIDSLNPLTFGEELLYRCSELRLYIGANEAGKGYLYIGSRNVYWINENNSEHRYIFSFYTIGLNAVFNKNEDFDSCVYCQIDGLYQIPNLNNGSHNNNGNDEDDDDEEDEEEYTEVRFIPNEESKIKEIYESFCRGALLNPDPEEEDEGNFYFNESDMMNMVVDNNMQYEDDEEEEDEEDYDQEQCIEMPNPNEVDDLMKFQDANEDDNEQDK